MNAPEIRRAAEVLRRYADDIERANEVGGVLWQPPNDAIMLMDKRDHAEMIDLAGKLEKLARKRTNAKT